MLSLNVLKFLKFGKLSSRSHQHALAQFEVKLIFILKVKFLALSLKTRCWDWLVSKYYIRSWESDQVNPNKCWLILHSTHQNLPAASQWWSLFSISPPVSPNSLVSHCSIFLQFSHRSEHTYYVLASLDVHLSFSCYHMMREPDYFAFSPPNKFSGMWRGGEKRWCTAERKKGAIKREPKIGADRILITQEV